MVYNTCFKAKFGSMPSNEWAGNMSGFDQAMMGLSYCINWSYSLEAHVIQVHFAFSHSWFELWTPVLKIRFRMKCYVCSDSCMGQYMGVTIYCLNFFFIFLLSFHGLTRLSQMVEPGLTESSTPLVCPPVWFLKLAWDVVQFWWKCIRCWCLLLLCNCAQPASCDQVIGNRVLNSKVK